MGIDTKKPELLPSPAIECSSIMPYLLLADIELKAVFSGLALFYIPINVFKYTAL
jgi:hypothetical protein